MELSPTIFRAYDIRGIVAEDFTPPQVNRIFTAFASFLLLQKKTTEQKTVVIGFDGRISSPALHDLVCSALMASGLRVISIGCVTTPMLYFASYHLDALGAVMITGSHNPPPYNGFKLLCHNQALFDEQIQAIYHLTQTGLAFQGNGSLTHFDIAPLYAKAIHSRLKIKRPLRVVIDAGNGVTGAIAPTVLKRLHMEVIPLFCEVDGRFPNHHPDPAKPENLKALIAAVQTEKADVGLAFDGDGDRLGVVSQSGKIIWPDRLLYLFARDLLKRIPYSKIVYDVKCTRDLETLRLFNGNPIVWKTGHSLIKAKMRSENALLGGEMSGHFFFSERWFGFDDGLYAGCRLLEILSNTGLSLDALLEAIPERVSSPEITIPVEEQEKFLVIKKIQSLAPSHVRQITMDGLRLEFEAGWGLVRASNTTPNLVLRFEANTEAAFLEIKTVFFNLLKQVGVPPIS